MIVRLLAALACDALAAVIKDFTDERLHEGRGDRRGGEVG
jgi:hypothetical protein